MELSDFQAVQEDITAVEEWFTATFTSAST